MSTQLYEVDVFMFFLKDLEAVTTNFYHDLWQSTRMHTPKVCSFHTHCNPLYRRDAFICTVLQQLDLGNSIMGMHWTSAAKLYMQHRE